MARAKFRAIIPTKLPGKVFDDAFEKAARKMEKDVKGVFQDYVANWKHQPDFRGYVRVGSSDIYISVGTTDEVFKFLDEGTIRHFVAPVNATVLHWITPEGTDAFSMGHWVKGIKAREMVKSVMDTWTDLMPEYFDANLKVAVQESGHAIN